MQCTGPMHPRLLPRLWGKGLWWVHAGEMGRERSSVLLEITIAMLRAEEHKALLGNWLFSLPHPPVSSGPIFCGVLRRMWGRGVAAPHRGPEVLLCPPWEAMGWEYLQRNAELRLGLSGGGGEGTKERSRGARFPSAAWILGRNGYVGWGKNAPDCRLCCRMRAAGCSLLGGLQREGQDKSLCYCNSLPSGTFHSPTGLFCGPGLQHSPVWVPAPLEPMDFFVCVLFIMARASVNSIEKIFGAFCYFPLFLLLLMTFLDQMLGCALWSSAILCLEASQGGVLCPGDKMLFGRKGKLHPALQRAGGL